MCTIWTSVENEAVKVFKKKKKQMKKKPRLIEREAFISIFINKTCRETHPKVLKD